MLAIFNDPLSQKSISFWLYFILSQEKFTKEYKQIKKSKLDLPIKNILLSIISGKSGNFEISHQYLNDITNDHTKDSWEIKELILAVRNLLNYKISLTEFSKKFNLNPPEYLKNKNHPYLINSYFIYLYIACEHSIHELKLNESKSHFSEMMDLINKYEVKNFKELQDFTENIYILENYKNLDHLDAYLIKKTYIFTKGNLHNLSFLLRLRSKRGDYEGVYALIRNYPDIVLPPKTKLIVSLSCRKPIKYNRLEIDSNPELYWVNVFEGVISRNPDTILRTKYCPSDKYPPSIHISAKMSYAWAHVIQKNYQEAAKLLNNLNLLSIGYDQLMYYYLLILRIYMEAGFNSSLLSINFQTAISKATEIFPLLARGKFVFEKVLIPESSEAIWVLMCFDELFYEYYYSSERIIIFADGIFINGKFYTSKIYRDIFTQGEHFHGKEAIKKAKQRILYKSISEKRHIILDFSLIEGIVAGLIDFYPSNETFIQNEYLKLYQLSKTLVHSDEDF